mgnify:CR=1 FL=1
MLSVKQSFILITTLFVGIYLGTRVYLKFEGGKYEESDIMRNAMGNILIIFGFLKLVNIGGFVEVFSKYDIIANNIELYGYFYPFLEIMLGIALLKRYRLEKIYNIIIVIMSISVMSVIASMSRGVQLRCGCIGSIFHIPLSYVTLSENVVMILMSLYLKRLL